MRSLLRNGCSICSKTVDEAQVAHLAGRPCLTVTPDRGKEFASHADMTRRPGGTQLYLCRPHSPWQKGTVENTNGLIGEFFPKGTDSSKADGERVREVFALINDRPRRVLGYRTPMEAYREELLRLG